MPYDFTKVVIRNVTRQTANIHLAVHPFPFTEVIHLMMRKGDYTKFSLDGAKECMSDWQKKLADDLWDKIPGLHTLFFSNGEITIQHQGVFSDEEIIEAATEIIRPYLEDFNKLSKLWG